MENVRVLLNKIKTIDSSFLEPISKLESRLKIVCTLNHIRLILEKYNFGPTISNINFELIFNMILLLFKSTHKKFDFLNYDKSLKISSDKCVESELYQKKINEINNNRLKLTSSIPKVVDLNISSGGNAGFIGCGIIDILKMYSKENNIVIDRISGISFGSLLGFFYIADIPCIDCINVYTNAYNIFKSDNSIPQGNAMYEIWMHYLKDSVDPEIYKKCNNKLFITYGEVNNDGIEFKTKSNFTSNNDVFLTCLCSCTIPFLSIDGSCTIMDNKKNIDIGFLKPIDSFGEKDELNIDYSKIFYDPNKLLMPIDDEIHKLVYRGAEEMMTFLETSKSTMISLTSPKKN